MSEEFVDEPVVFIAVNSGNSKEAVAHYLEANDVPWPAIADRSREFEEAVGFSQEISLENIYQVRYLTGDGKLGYGDPHALSDVVKTALEDASWKVRPSNVPDSLKTAWRALEFGNYQVAAKGIGRGLKSSDAETKLAAKKFEASVMKEFKKQVNGATALARNGKFWPAHKVIAQVEETFGEFDLPKRFYTMKEKLEEKPEVVTELKALRQLKKGRELAGSRVKPKASIGRKRLESLIEDYPDTDAAATARSLLGLPPADKFR